MTYIILFSAVIIGVFIGEIAKPKEFSKKIFLNFSGTFLLSITFFHILPDIYTHNSNHEIGLFIMLGVFTQIILESYSKGIEHAHELKKEVHSKDTFTISMFISISIHAILEGAPIDGHTLHPISTMEAINPVLLGVFIHKIPIASIIYIAFREKGFSIYSSFLIIIIFGFMTPLGTFISNNFTEIQQFSTQINAIVVGVFLHIGTSILFENSPEHKFNLPKITIIIFTTLLVYFFI